MMVSFACAAPIRTKFFPRTLTIAMRLYPSIRTIFSKSRHLSLFSSAVHFNEDDDKDEEAAITKGTLYPSANNVQSSSASSFLEHNKPKHTSESEELVEHVAKSIREKVRNYTAQLRIESKESPLLVGIFADDDPSAEEFCENISQVCKEDGIRYDLRKVEKKESSVEAMIQDANDDPTVTGIQIYYPIFSDTSMKRGPYKNEASGVYFKSHDDYLRNMVSVRCDVEGLSQENHYSRYQDSQYYYVDHQDDDYEDDLKCMFPCTALAVVKILEACPDCYDITMPIGQRFKGKVITIINRSEIIGRPLAAMLSNDGATVYSVDVNSILLFQNGTVRRLHESATTLESCVKHSSLVITGVPDPTFRVPTDWIQPNSTVLNVAFVKNVDEEELMDGRIPGVRYIPLIGKVTVAILEQNLIRLHRKFT